MTTTSKKRVRSALCTAVSFIAALLITGGILCATLFVTAFNDDFAVSVTSRSKYADLLSKELKESFISYGRASNIEDTFFDSLFKDTVTTQKISADTEQILRDFYAGNVNDSVNTDDLNSAIFENLKEYATQKSFTLDDETTENLQLIATELCDIYNAYVSVFSLSYFRTASRALAAYKPYALYGMCICGAGLIFSMVILRLFFRKKKNYLRYYIYAFSGASLMLSAAPIIALIAGIGGRINISSAALYTMASGMLNSIFIVIAVSAIIPVACTVLIAVIWNAAYRKNI